MTNIPDFQTLSVDTIPTLADEALAAATCAALDALRDGPGALEGALELLEEDEADALYQQLWRVSLAPRTRGVPDPNPYGAEETSEVQEALVGLLREGAARRAAAVAPYQDLLDELGDAAAQELADRADAWRDRYPTPV